MPSIQSLIISTDLTPLDEKRIFPIHLHIINLSAHQGTLVVTVILRLMSVIIS